MEFIDLIQNEYQHVFLGVLFALLISAIVALSVWIVRIENRIQRILGGKKAQDIEGSLTLIHTELKDLRAFKREMHERIDSLEGRVRRSIQGVETVRFNPFKGSGSGGNHSFASSFLDENGDGVVISSLYSRERMSIYAKPVKQFSSEHSLSEEEENVLRTTQQRLKNPSS